jgi:hypothetical protein
MPKSRKKLVHQLFAVIQFFKLLSRIVRVGFLSLFSFIGLPWARAETYFSFPRAPITRAWQVDNAHCASRHLSIESFWRPPAKSDYKLKRSLGVPFVVDDRSFSDVSSRYIQYLNLSVSDHFLSHGHRLEQSVRRSDWQFTRSEGYDCLCVWGCNCEFWYYRRLVHLAN